MSIEYNLQFDKLCRKLNLGMLCGKPEQIFGGHLHRMYSIQTNSGKYAIKALNPQVMLRPEAKQNIINSEHIANIAKKKIHVLCAKVFDNTYISEFDGQYYLVFDWIDGISIFDEKISSLHCEKMGQILARLHQLDFSSLCLVDEYSSDEKLTDWAYYLKIGRENNAEWIESLSKNIDHLYKWNNLLIKAAKQLSKDTVISHGDLEPKNVMWQDDKPIIIDWEAAGFIHPMHDLIETALYWSDEKDIIKKYKFIAFIMGYKSISGKLDANWSRILEKGFGGKLSWLEYSLKRSLGIECSDEMEKKMGTDHVFDTIKMLNDYNNLKDNIINWIVEIK